MRLAFIPSRYRPDLARILGWTTAMLVNLVVAAVFTLPSHPRAERFIGPPEPEADDDYLLMQPLPRYSRLGNDPSPLPSPCSPGCNPSVDEACPPHCSGGAQALSGDLLQPLIAPPPVYPTDGLVQNISGTVILEVHVAADGTVEDVVIEHSSGHRSLDASARDQVLRHWRFKPVIVGGHAVAVVARLPVVFSLAGN